MKKTCTKYAAWREKKGTLLNFVCLEINLAVVPTDTWWIDIGATTHISVTMQGGLRSQVSIDAERFIYMGNDNKTLVKAIDLFRLQLEFGCYLDLDDTFYVPSIRLNLVSVSRLDKYDYSCSFGNGKRVIFNI